MIVIYYKINVFDLSINTKYYPHKSNLELRQSLFLFKILSRPFFVRLSLYIYKFLNFINFPIQSLIKFTGYDQFCAGISVESSYIFSRRMAEYNVYSALDYANEHGENEDDFEHNTLNVLKTIDFAISNNSYPFAVLKPSAIGSFYLFEKKSNQQHFSSNELFKWEKINQRMNRLANAAANAGLVLMIDAEESWIQKGVNSLVLPLLRKFNSKNIVIAITFSVT